MTAITRRQTRQMKVNNADISWLESGLPYSTRYDDVYYSRDDELAESQHVFIEANRLRQRWQSDSGTEVFHLGELGFGSGLNFLQTMQLWQSLEARPARLHYLAFEKHPLTREQLQRIYRRWPSLRAQSAELLAQYTDHGGGCHRLLLTDDITLDLYFGDAAEQLAARANESCPAIQCWFLDGFSPSNNGELWEQALMDLIAACSDASTTLSSYSVAGRVRAALGQAGFEVSRVEGFGRKRHSLIASRPNDESQTTAQPSEAAVRAPWFIVPKTQYPGRTAAIIGAGLAGCSTAYSLALRGWRVTVFDAADSPASGASGNAALALRCRLYNAESAQALFFLQAYLFALRQFSVLQHRSALAWNPCGLLQLQGAMNKRSPLRAEKLRQLYSERLVLPLSREQASRQADIELREAAWYFPGGGMIEPASLCAAYLAHSNIDCKFDTAITAITAAEGRCRLQSDAEDSRESDVVIIANSHAAARLTPSLGLPLEVWRGQTAEVAASEESARLNAVVCGGRTVFPAVAGRHLLSASYSDSAETETSASERQANVEHAISNFSGEIFDGDSVLAERVSFRCSTPDRLPIVGMLPDGERMRASYAELGRNARARFEHRGDYHRGVYINVAHGSNGLASCPLSAELLASQINGENLPLSRDTMHCLSPARFLIADLKKQRG